MLISERHDRHAAHGMADEHDRGLTRRDGRQHRVQIGAELVDADAGMVLAGPGGPAVAALVPEHQAADAAQVPALVMPAVLVQRVAVAENDRDRRIIPAIDLDMQRDAVIGQHRAGAAAQLAERLRRFRVGLQPLPADRYFLGGDDGTHPGRQRADGQAGRAGDPPPPGHLTSRYVLAPRDAACFRGSVTAE